MLFVTNTEFVCQKSLQARSSNKKKAGLRLVVTSASAAKPTTNSVMQKYVALTARSRLLQSFRKSVCVQPWIGTRKLHYLLKSRFEQAGLKIGRDALFHILRQAHLLVIPKRSYHKTTQSHHRFYRHPNLLRGGGTSYTPSRSEEIRVADITYLNTRKTPVYLSLVTDAYSRRIMSYHVHETLHTQGIAQALKMTIRHRKTKDFLIHHSDRGTRYCSLEYQRIHDRHQITCSMTDGYDCYQNALAERMDGILKMEFLLHLPEGLREARKMLEESIHIYNHERPHSALQYETPDAQYQASIRQSLNQF